MRRTAFALGLALTLFAGGALAQEGEEGEPPPPLEPSRQAWTFDGPFGTFDRASLQRGFQIYNDVCSGCHALHLVAYRDLGPAGPSGGIGFNDDEVKAIAAAKQVPDLNDQGETIQRKARPSDRFVSPFANELAARAVNNGAYPPDLSLIVKARAGGLDTFFGAHGSDYIYALLTGYGNAPAGFKMDEGMNYNPYFPGHQIAMLAPLSDNSVTYADNTPATLNQEAYDVVNFLAWAAEPNLEDRHRTGLKAIIFLVVMTGVLYAAKRRIWHDVH